MQMEKTPSSVHAAQWRTKPSSILTLLFALVSACIPSLCATHGTPAARRRPAEPRRARSLLPWTARGVSVASSQVLQVNDKNRRQKALVYGHYSCWPPAARSHRVFSDVSVPPVRRLARFYFCFQEANDPGRWRMRRVALPARMRTLRRSAVAELTDAFR